VAESKRSAAPAVMPGDLGAVDTALELIGALESDASAIESERDVQIGAIRTDYDARRDSLLASAREQRDLVEKFADLHPELFMKPRRQNLPHGVIGYKEVQSIEFLKSEDKVVAALESRGLDAAVITTKTPNKQVLKTYPDDVLAGVAVKRASEDQFYLKCRPAETPKPIKHSA